MTHFLSPTLASFPSDLLSHNIEHICQYCKAIRFADLPGEDEPGFPHQPSLKALKGSANQCALCALILGAAYEVRKSVDLRHKGIGRGGWVGYQPGELSDGTQTMGHFQLGDFGPGSDTCVEGPAQPATDMPGYLFADDAFIRPWLFGNWWKSRNSSGPLQLIGLGVRLATTPNMEDAEGNGNEIYYPNGNPRIDLYYHGTFLRIRTEDDAPMAAAVPGRLRATDSASEFSFCRLMKWIETCNREHGGVCAGWALLSATLPTRVLDVGVDSKDIKLVETSGQNGAYIALSHRWGGSGAIMTTCSTIGTRKSGIPLSSLPPTFLDAVLIARRIKIRYLWIDSLCIIQDDPSDWEREASKMANIYANSYLTIAAAASSDTYGGCFPTWNRRSKIFHTSPDSGSLGMPFLANAAPWLDTQGDLPGPRWVAEKRFVFLDSSHDGQQSRIYIHAEWMPSSTRAKPTPYFIGGFGRRFDPLEHVTLNSRGWTLQERLLSPRIVHYAEDQMYWECEKEFLGEDGSVFDPTFFSLNVAINGQYVPPSERGIRQHGTASFVEGLPVRVEAPEGRWRGGWLAHIESYSMRNLTVGEDKLPALSGLANFIASRTGDEYYGGIWRDHIIEELHWRVYAREEVRQGGSQIMNDELTMFFPSDGGFKNEYGQKFCDVVVPSTYRAPSWSWASLDTRIKFVPLDFSRIKTEFISGHIRPAGSDGFGKVAGGLIKLLGPLVEIHKADPSREYDRSEPLGFGELTELHLDHGVSLGEAYFDVQPHFPCFALFLDSSHSLILRPTRTTEHEYVRIGIANFLRTQKQRLENPIPTFKRENEAYRAAAEGDVPKVPLGPITDGDARVFVTIV